ncbi:hypothetical protein BT63DRAFT_451322 [Microthyrium microscopicum]|uniref:Uncharacterized protein n=1 Tax=Microthyrium microscopicum TaxID=703497 RepID=A0A6A6UNK6_9PEZI|nr:hypothetical protein BT63DRAFT_451322 [Microthyrium microscopicum]
MTDAQFMEQFSYKGLALFIKQSKIPIPKTAEEVKTALDLYHTKWQVAHEQAREIVAAAATKVKSQAEDKQKELEEQEVRKLLLKPEPLEEEELEKLLVKAEALEIEVQDAAEKVAANDIDYLEDSSKDSLVSQWKADKNEAWQQYDRAAKKASEVASKVAQETGMVVMNDYVLVQVQKP